MPKKHKAVYSHQGQSNYTHPSLGSSKLAGVGFPPIKAVPPASVNERLHQLRREQTSAEETQRQIEAASRSNQRSVPPSLGGILGLPDSAPPAPKPGARQRTRLRTPGPAPPRSWVDGSYSSYSLYNGSVARSARRFGEKKCISRPRTGGSLSFHNIVGQQQIPRQSLLHIALKTIAINWKDIADDGLCYLSECPGHVRSALIAYIARFGPEDGLSPRALEILLQNQDSIDCLDLTALAGWSLSIKTITSILTEKPLKAPNAGAEIDSWDAEDPTPVPSISKLTLRTINSITKLGFAEPPPTVSWNDLLALTAKLPTLTHLSIAQWPYPTKTPRLVNATTSSPTGKVLAASGTSMYALLDGDLSEASSVLRHFARNTYCLRYLDLSGCEWTQALAPSSATLSSRFRHTRMIDEDEWLSATPLTGTTAPDWLGSWKNMTLLKMGQSRSPETLPLVTGFDFSTSHPAAGSSMDARFVRRDLLKHLVGDHNAPHDPPHDPPHAVAADRWNSLQDICCGSTSHSLALDWRPSDSRNTLCNACGLLIGSLEGMIGKSCHVCEAWHGNAKRATDAWVEAEVRLRETARAITAFRQLGAGPALLIDLGWMTM